MSMRTVDVERVKGLALFSGVSDETFKGAVRGAFLQKSPGRHHPPARGLIQ